MSKSSHHVFVLFLVTCVLLPFVLITLHDWAAEAMANTTTVDEADDWAVAEEPSVPGTPNTVSGPQKVVVLRVYFADYPATSRYTQAQVQGFFDNEVNTMWQKTSYGNISISATVSALYQLPRERSHYIDDISTGDLSRGLKYHHVLRDAVDAVGGAVDYTGVKAVLVVMAETNSGQFHRGQGNRCHLPVGPGGSSIRVGCAIFSENPDSPDPQVWGRWMHEMGHAFQDPGTPPHPSKYNNSYELMDALLPGHIGMWEKLRSFSNWVNLAMYYVIPASGPGSGGATVVVYAEEYQPGEVAPGAYRAIKVQLTAGTYYIITVRAPINGDEVRPIPDTEGVLIERVVQGGNPWVTVKSSVPPPSAQGLWHVGQTYSNTFDSIYITVMLKPDPNKAAYQIMVQREATSQPDVMIRQWQAPPLNTYETTDIWVDSSCNSYGYFMYGVLTPAGDSTTVGFGNGDSPCANHANRVYARVRNVGTSAAAGVVVHFEVTDPLGVGINGASGWTSIGTVTLADFPALASLAPGAYADVYVPWTPVVALTPELIAQGNFNFHTCLRVRMDTVAGETDTANQDGHDEQENISMFFAAPYSATVAPPLYSYVYLANDSTTVTKTFDLDWDSNFPPSWTVIVNNDTPSVDVGPSAVVTIPVYIAPIGPTSVGQTYSMTLAADWLNQLVRALDPTDIHYEYLEMGGATLGLVVADPSSFYLRPERTPGGVRVQGTLVHQSGANSATAIRVDLLAANHNILTGQTITTDARGFFDVFFDNNSNVAKARYALAIYQGQASKGIYRQPAVAEALIANAYLYLPMIRR